jgi:hypothetical protein
LKGKNLDFLKSDYTRLLTSGNVKMFASTKLVDKLEGVDNLCACKYRIALILEENDLARFIKEDVLEPTDVAAKEKHQKDTVRAKRIIADSIKDHLIPQVASKKTPKEMFDVLTRMYEGKNINRKMNLRINSKVQGCRKEKQFRNISLEYHNSRNN